MSKIEDYYHFIDKFNGELNDRQKGALEELEDQLIADEILPAISESVAPVLGILRRHLTIVVDYDPQGGITVKTTRGQVVINEHTAKKYEIPSTSKVVKVAEAKKKEHKEPAKRAPKTGLCVWLPDGSLVQETKAKFTMTAIENAGVEAVAKLRIPHDSLFLVSREKHPLYAANQQKLSHGYLLDTHSSNKAKKRQLYKISKALNLGWKVEIIE